ncbi:type IVB secretion system protein IcmW, partial [Facilibium subflavum]
MKLNERIQQFWQDNADSFLKTLLIHIQKFDQSCFSELDENQQQQLSTIIAHIHKATYTDEKAKAYLTLANNLPLAVMYFILKSTQQENYTFTESLLSYVFENDTDDSQLFKSKNIELEKAQLLVRYINCDNLQKFTVHEE